MNVPVLNGPGHVVKGSIFDCNRATFERAIKAYASNLFVGWNPYKNQEQGCWEVWAMPSKKTPIYQGSIDGHPFYSLETVPNDFEHHVYDLQYLTLDFVGKLREMDMWANRHYLDQMDQYIDDYEQELDEKLAADIKYTVKHNKSVFRKLKQFALDGLNPLWFFSDRRQGDGEV